MSCRGHSRKLCIFTQKELETVNVAHKLLGALTIGGEVPGQGMVVEGVTGSKEVPDRPKYTIMVPKTGSLHHFLA
jgi:hypothetical protein